MPSALLLHSLRSAKKPVRARLAESRFRSRVPPVSGGMDFCGPISNPLFGSNQFVGANFDPGVASGWGKRPSDWSFSVSVQQEIAAEYSW